MQSAGGPVRAVLDRTHPPGRAGQVVKWARESGFEHVNLDLIYGAPGESDDDWRASLEAALAAPPDHLSAYPLIVEEGAKLAARGRRGRRRAAPHHQATPPAPLRAPRPRRPRAALRAPAA